MKLSIFRDALALLFAAARNTARRVVEAVRDALGDVAYWAWSCWVALWGGG